MADHHEFESRTYGLVAVEFVADYWNYISHSLFVNKNISWVPAYLCQHLSIFFICINLFNSQSMKKAIIVSTVLSSSKLK